MQQLEVSGTCLESSLFGSTDYRFSDIQISISANDESKYVSFSNVDFFDLKYEKEVLFICFVSKKAIQSIVGNVKEALIQEVGVVLPDNLCELPPSSGDPSYASVFGSKGVLALNSTATGLTIGITTSIKHLSKCLLAHCLERYTLIQEISLSKTFCI